MFVHINLHLTHHNDKAKSVFITTLQIYYKRNTEKNDIA